MAGRSMDEAPSKRWRKHMDENGLRKRALWVPKEHADEAECIHQGHSNPSPLRIFLDPFEGVLFLPVGGRHADHCLTRKGTSSPASLLQQAFEILASSDAQGFAIDAPEQPQTEAAQAMPVFGLCKEGFDPDLALVQGFLVGRGLLVALDPFHIVSKKGAVDVPTTGAFGTLCFHWAGIADRRISTVLDLLCAFHAIRWTQNLALRTVIQILAGIVAKLRQSIITHVVLASFGDGDVGPDVGFFDGFEVLSRSIQAISGDLLGPQMPTKAGVPEPILHGMIVHHLPGSDQHRENDATFASIDHVVGMIAQMGSASLQAHRSSVRIGGADAQVGGALIIPTHFSRRSSLFSNPVMPGGNFLSEFLLLWFGEGDWEWERDRAGHDFCCSGFWRRGNGICRCRLLLRLCVFIRKKGREMGL